MIVCRQNIDSHWNREFYEFREESSYDKMEWKNFIERHYQLLSHGHSFYFGIYFVVAVVVLSYERKLKIRRPPITMNVFCFCVSQLQAAHLMTDLEPCIHFISHKYFCYSIRIIFNEYVVKKYKDQLIEWEIWYLFTRRHKLLLSWPLENMTLVKIIER